MEWSIDAGMKEGEDLIRRTLDWIGAPHIQFRPNAIEAEFNHIQRTFAFLFFFFFFFFSFFYFYFIIVYFASSSSDISS